MNVGTCVSPLSSAVTIGDLKGLCHGDDFSVVARRKQLQTFGKVLQKRFLVKQTGHIGFWCKWREGVEDPESNNQDRCAGRRDDVGS